MTAIWRGEVPTLVLLNQMVGDTLPLGLRAGIIRPFFQRDIYFDSPDRVLHRRGVTCRFRVRVDDVRILSVRVTGVASGGAPPETFETAVTDLEAEQALTGTSEPARRLRALIDPDRLRRQIEFETERRARPATARWWARARYDILYDVVTVRSGQLARSFQELQVRELRSGRPTLEALAQAFTRRYNVRPLLVGKLERAERALRDLESTPLAQMAHESREVALVVLQDGDIALWNDVTGLKLPVSAGQGEAPCRELLRELFDSADGQLRLLGTASASASRPLLDTWLARRATDAKRSVSGRLQWIPVAEVLAMAGSPGLRDPRTLSALTVFTRSEQATPVLSEPAGRTGEGRRRRLSDVTVSKADTAHPSADQVLSADLSVLEFNARVLSLAEDTRVPLLARLRYLSIVSANLDEFFMVRVSTLKHGMGTETPNTSEAGLSPEQELDAIRLRVRTLLGRQTRCFTESCLPALTAARVRLAKWRELTTSQRDAMQRYFEDRLFPVITPQAITRAPGHPFPVVPHLRLSLAVVVRNPRGGPAQFAYLKVPEGVPRFVPLPGGQEGEAGLQAFIPVEDVIREHLGALYPGLLVESAYTFRVTRAADLELDERQAVSLLQVIGEEASRRPYGPPVRLEVQHDMPEPVRHLILRELQFDDAVPDSLLSSGDVYESPAFVDLGALRELAQLPLPALDYPPHHGASPIPLDRSIFATIAEHDVLVHHPYDAFATTVERLFVEAADDPDVLAIKLTLYRAGGRSSIVDALLRAAQRGKEVFVFVELKARFDEERNIEWTRKLEQGGVRVVYGLVDFKTHAKTALIVRREPGGIKRYVHLGTGNYNAATATLYTDLGLLSADAVLSADLHDFFNELSGSSQPPRTEFRALLISPVYLLPRLVALIDREAELARAGRGGSIRAKLNGLADPDIVAALYRASQAGAEIELVVRGICTLRPGVVGLSERIRVVSIVGRFLEHARVFRFGNAGDPDYFIGSADWRPRNLRRRVEVVAPVRDPACRKRLEELLEKELADPEAWELLADGSYAHRDGAIAGTGGGPSPESARLAGGLHEMV